jgi:hypothetical protein
LGWLFRLARSLPIPAPDRPVVRATIFLAFQIEARNVAKDLQPGRRIPSDLDLRFDRSERVDRLVEEVAHHAVLRLGAGGADIANGQVVVHAHVALDEASHLPVVRRAIVVFEDQDVAATGGASIAFAPTLVVRVSQGRTDRFAQRRRIA